MPARRVITGRSQEPRLRFTEELRALRTQRGDSLRKVAERLGWDSSLIHKLECGQSMGGPEVVQALDQHYGTGNMLLTLWELAMADKTMFRERYRRYMLLEEEAVSLWHYAVGVPPGLLQTEAYARELIASGGTSGEELDQQVAARIGRRHLLTGKLRPAFRTILSESVLRTPLRDAREWRAQLEHLVEAADQPNITVQVMPYDVGVHALMTPDVMFLRLTDGRTVAYIENDIRGELIEATRRVEELQRRYDRVRDLALSPTESRTYIMQRLEETQCDA